MNTVWISKEGSECPLFLNNKSTSEMSSSQRTSLNHIPPLMLQLLKKRGLSEDHHLFNWIYPQVSELKDPFLMKGMSGAIQRIIKAFKNEETICIYADFDLDGTSGLALMIQGLRAMGFKKLIPYQPKRLSEGYGFHAAAVEDLAKNDVSLVVTVDVGISSLAACAKAQELGVDVIITDHHLPGETLPKCLFLVNPNQGDCPSGMEYLCGAGVAFYLLRGLKRAFHDDASLPQNSFDLKEVLEFFTIATLTDMVPLVEDNRTLVKLGLKSLSETNKAGMKALLKELNLYGRPLNSQDVAIRFAPKLNALSRMETEILPIDILLEENDSKAESLVSQILKNNSTRVSLQASAESEAMEKLQSWTEPHFVYVASPNFHRGVLGLIATKLAQTYNKPSFVGAIDSDGVIVGSARMPAGMELSLVEAMSQAKDHLTRFGGHSAAAGFELYEKSQIHFIEKLREYFIEQTEKPRPLQVEYDLEIKLDEINAGLMKWYEFLGPFGVSFPIPIFLFKNISISKIKTLKGGHYRLSLLDIDSGASLEALLFSPTPRQVSFLESTQDSFDILGELQWNYFAGNKSIQILIKDLKPCFDLNLKEKNE